MRFSLSAGIALAALAAAVFAPQAANAACDRVVVRKEFRDLSSQERTAFMNALVKVFKSSAWTSLSQTHVNNAHSAHNSPVLLPWHRQFVQQLQQELWKHDASVVMPYWDSSLDSQNPASSVIFNYFGSSKQNDCVPDGPFANYKLAFPNNRCLVRGFNPTGVGMSTFVTSEALGQLVRTESDYSDFESAIEYGMHAVVHNAIGGSSGDMSYMYSPNDPIFFMHHAFVDKLWYDWQILHGVNTYDGSVNGNLVATSDVMVPFNVPVSSVMDAQGSLCYVYAQPGASVPPPTTTSTSSRASNTVVSSSSSTRGTQGTSLSASASTSTSVSASSTASVTKTATLSSSSAASASSCPPHRQRQ